jgi:hypothetical protein
VSGSAHRAGLRGGGGLRARALAVLAAIAAIAVGAALSPAAGQEPLPAPAATSASAAVRLARGARFVRVVAAAGEDVTAASVERVRRTVVAALPEIERAAGFPCPRRGAVVVHVHADPEATGGYYGQNEGRAIRVQHDITDHGLLHELAHEWFAGELARDTYVSERWLVEGLAEYTAVRAERALLQVADPAWSHAQNVASWTSGFAGDEPLLRRGVPRYPLDGTAESSARASDWYGRAYAFFHLLAARIGHARLAEVSAAVARVGEPVGSLRYLAELARVEPDAVRLCAGWHTRGEFHPHMHPDLAADGDGDGLSAAEERALGTDDAALDGDGDGVGDGAEVLMHGTDPRDAASGPALAYAIDGDLADWSARRPGARYRYDLPGDLENGAPPVHDLRSAWIDADATYLYAALGFERTPTDDVQAELGLDVDGDAAFDVVIRWSGARGVSVARLLDGWEGADRHPIHLAEVARDGKRVELALPRAALGAEIAGDVRVWIFTTYVQRDGERVYADQHHAWVPLHLP